MSQKVQPLNYCRQILKKYTEYDKSPAFDFLTKIVRGGCKFSLPHGGIALTDYELKNLVDISAIHLPFQSVCLEWKNRVDGINSGNVLACTEDGGEIKCVSLMKFYGGYDWVTVCVFSVSCDSRVSKSSDGVVFSYKPLGLLDGGKGLVAGEVYKPAVLRLLSFLNALACSNVRAERIEPKKQKVKAALQFDAYHILTIAAPARPGSGVSAGAHRSPREHLRRGHIRRLESGQRVWVNAAVVAAGRGAGVVSKDYAIKKPA